VLVRLLETEVKYLTKIPCSVYISSSEPFIVPRKLRVDWNYCSSDCFDAPLSLQIPLCPAMPYIFITMLSLRFWCSAALFCNLWSAVSCAWPLDSAIKCCVFQIASHFVIFNQATSNPLKPSGQSMYHQLCTVVLTAFLWILMYHRV